MGDLYDFETKKKIKKTRRKSSPIDYTLNLLVKNKHKYKYMIVIARDFNGDEDRYLSTNTSNVTSFEMAQTLLKSIIKDLLDDKTRDE